VVGLARQEEAHIFVGAAVLEALLAIAVEMPPECQIKFVGY